ncbi:MAG: FtsX-like permease family protein [Thermoproteota archaeon]|nr:FtsX-like permease family protein [Thermoproteota archaeon]
MNVAKTFRISFKALGDRKVRTSLTILMVIVGSSLMVTLNGIVAGLGQFATDVFNKLAPNILFITSIPTDGPGRGGDNAGNGGGGGGPPSFLSQGLIPVPTITLDQAVASKLESLPHVSAVIPSYQGRITIALDNRSQSASVLSVQPENLRIIAPALEFTEGSTIKSEDESAIYLPSLMANNLQAELSEAAPVVDNDVGSVATMVGQQVNVTFTYIDLATASRQSYTEVFTVAGIMKPVGNPTIDRAVIFNLEAGNKFFQKSGRYDSLFVAAESTDHVTQVEKEIRDIYGSDIGITTSQAILQSIGEFTAGFGTAISSIALVALLVGSVGIVTTMYTSVTERTREIGVMKAIGARDRNVLALFLTESALIGIIGASIGLVVGVLGGYGVLSLFALNSIGPSELTPYYSWIDLGRVWVLSLGLSIAAGLYPAWKASKLSPIVALRRE